MDININTSQGKKKLQLCFSRLGKVRQTKVIVQKCKQEKEIGIIVIENILHEPISICEILQSATSLCLDCKIFL